MCRWLAYWGPAVHMDSLIFEPEHSLVRQSLRARHGKLPTNGDGFGIGWYGERAEPGLYRDILPAWSDPNLKSLTHQVRSPLFFAHVRASTGTATSRANCHPFACGKWLFMHNGRIGGYERVKRPLESALADGFYEQRLGTTDSELMFYLMLSLALDADPLGALARMLGLVQRTMRERKVEEPLSFTAALSNGESLIAARWASDDEPPSLYWRADGDALVVVSEPLDERLGCWHEVPPNRLLVASCPAEPCIEEVRLAV